MSVQEFKSLGKKIAYCIVDNTHSYTNGYTKELIKNQSDYTLTNITCKGYDVFTSTNEDLLIRHCVGKYDYCVVISTGTEFINGSNFFDEIEKRTTSDFFIMGHVLDRNEAYYELHHQCYVINLEYYKKLGMPDIGKQELGSSHNQEKPLRSLDNLHDDYTPIWVSSGDITCDYKHKLHGWNILRIAFENNLPVIVFDESIRQHKKYYYPENQTEFNKHITWSYLRHNYCLTEFIHTQHTETIIGVSRDIQQVFTTASGTWFTDFISKDKPVVVVMYDYNVASLNYWKRNVPSLSNVHYEFIQLDILTDDVDLTKFLNKNLPTVVNLSNVFVYEATTMFYSLPYRLAKENTLIKHIRENFTNCKITFSSRSCTGFTAVGCNDARIVSINELTTPSWHINGDWL